jgi:hypothetical protein
MKTLANIILTGIWPVPYKNACEITENAKCRNVKLQFYCRTLQLGILPNPYLLTIHYHLQFKTVKLQSGSVSTSNSLYSHIHCYFLQLPQFPALPSFHHGPRSQFLLYSGRQCLTANFPGYGVGFWKANNTVESQSVRTSIKE